MTEQTPYRFDLDDQTICDSLKSVRDAFTGSDKIEYKNQDYSYARIDKKLYPNVPGFVGMPNGHNLFASSEIPPELLSHSLQHEIECNRLRAGESGRCRKIEEELLTAADPAVRRQLVETRYKTFCGLVQHYKIDIEHPPLEEGAKKEIFGAYQYLHEQMQRMNEYVT